MSTQARLIRRQRRTQRKATQRRQLLSEMNADGQHANREKRRRERAKIPAAERRRQAIVAKMTNPERNAWAKAGYPADEAAFSRFAAAAIRRMGERAAA